MQWILEYLTNLSMMNKGLIVVFLTLLAYYGYTWYTRPQMMMLPPSPQRGMEQPPQHNGAGLEEQMNGGGEDAVVCTMYYVDWCKFCKKAKPEWAKLEQEYHGKTVNGKKILIVKINCEENPEVAEKEQIQGYPTFKFNSNGKYYDYPDEPTFDKFRVFIEHLTGLQD